MVSPFVFILAVKINHTTNIEGIAYAKKESRSDTFADDTSIFVKRNPEYLRDYVSILKHFARISGLQFNLEKTSVVPIGANFDTSDRLCTDLALIWKSEFTLFGFQIDSRLNKLDDNYEKCFTDLQISIAWELWQILL